ncbi:nuclear transport factor 2 family protein [Histomonas meleagridis]|uniref:nuclear transport factor 2 family protein n=1 Tax=Histomonas meleagridis TaxID=135588 RepID=UPI0035593CAA|nr:nuclear transport factor 2 family protein [Histomonas meleagridis]KAH0796686.1 nuclear transport factor 2 family protein [Histomonas meleagridis]
MRTTLSDYDAIIATVQKYVDGCLEGKSEIMKPAFDEGAVMYGVNVDGTVAAKGSINNLFTAIDQVGGDKNGKSRIDIIDSTANTAVARVVMENWHGTGFIDHHSLMKIDGQWKIVAKIYQSV